MVASAGPPSLLLTGSTGQLGWELHRALAPLGRVMAPDRHALDLQDLGALREAVDVHRPDVIVNAAGYRNADRAEREALLVERINADAPAVLAEMAARTGAILVHYSTDYVFDGTRRRPHTEEDTPEPLNVYGRSKLHGELQLLASGAQAYIFRVAWLYSLRGHNFLRTIQRLAAERDELPVVADQSGSPTWSRLIAEGTSVALSQLLSARREQRCQPPPGIYHMGAPDWTTWYDFACAIVDATPPPEGRNRPRVVPIPTSAWPAAARRPASSILDVSRIQSVFGIRLPPWREQLAMCLASGRAP